MFLQGDPGPSPFQTAEAAQGPQDLSTGLGSHRASSGLATDQSLEPPGLDAPTQEDGSSDMDLVRTDSGFFFFCILFFSHMPGAARVCCTLSCGHAGAWVPWREI